MTNFEGFKSYLIPDDKRQDYFDFVEKIRSNVNGINEENWKTYNDPIITIDFSYFDLYKSSSIKLFMSRIGAKEIQLNN